MEGNDETKALAEEAMPSLLPRLIKIVPGKGRRTRAGFTKNHNIGISKAKRKIAKTSKKRNRK